MPGRQVLLLLFGRGLETHDVRQVRLQPSIKINMRNTTTKSAKYLLALEDDRDDCLSASSSSFLVCQRVRKVTPDPIAALVFRGLGQPHLQEAAVDQQGNKLAEDDCYSTFDSRQILCVRRCQMHLADRQIPFAQVVIVEKERVGGDYLLMVVVSVDQ